MKTRSVNVFPHWTYYLLSTFLLHTCFKVANGFNSTNFHHSQNENHLIRTVPIIYDSSSIDGHLQVDLAKSIFLFMKILETRGFKPMFVDLSSFKVSNKLQSLHECSENLISNKFTVIVSLLGGDALTKFANVYDNTIESTGSKSLEKLHIYTPRSFTSLWKPPHSVMIKSLQMSEEARAVALLNRVGKVGVRTLIPVLDGGSVAELELLKSYYKIGSEKKLKIKFTKPILLSNRGHGDHLKTILQEHVGFNENRLRVHQLNKSITERNHTDAALHPGILLLARNTSNLAMKIAAEKRHLLLNWFSPNILEFEEWAYKQSLLSNNNADSQEGNRTTDFQGARNNVEESPALSGTAPHSSFFGLYTVNFVGSNGWDNPTRRQILRELAMSASTDASPKILLGVLTYDAVTLAVDDMSKTLKLPMSGLSGAIEFTKSGFRKSGTYLGTSLVPKTVSSNATLLQPSTWILEDVVSMKGKENHIPQISDYDVATSSILTKNELLEIANSTTHQVKCSEHLMKLIVHDPFTQMPYYYFFTPENLPETLVVPNHQGFGITFTCTHLPLQNSTSTNYNDRKQMETEQHLSTLRLACTPGVRMSHPINCFRSFVATRQKRDTTSHTNVVPSVQYQYSFSNNDPWLSQGSKWENSKDDSSNQYYYQHPSIGNRDYQAESLYGQPPRTDIPISEEPATPAPPPPPPPPPASKLPELRQILKAAKPFVGSCIGSTTGCAMCVLVLGRLPLGTAPPACTGPCFVGTFGSCGSLLGRVFSETTVICTELFKQGLLDVETFVADAEFGKYMSEASPYTMEGYTLLATPLVEVMKSSKLVTDTVATFAIPWAHHMKYLLGRTNETNLIGSTIHLIGYPLCNLFGRLHFFVNNLRNFFIPNIIVLISTVVPYLLTLLLIIILSANLRPTTSTHSINMFQRILNLYTLTSRSKKLFNEGVNYFKAIGRRT